MQNFKIQGKWEYSKSCQGWGEDGNSRSHAKILEIEMVPDFLTLEPEDNGLIPSDSQGKSFAT